MIKFLYVFTSIFLFASMQSNSDLNEKDISMLSQEKITLFLFDSSSSASLDIKDRLPDSASSFDTKGDQLSIWNTILTAAWEDGPRTTSGITTDQIWSEIQKAAEDKGMMVVLNKKLSNDLVAWVIDIGC